MGSVRSLEEAPCHLFDVTEVDDAVSLLIVSLAFYLDCFIIDARQRLMCFLSHDEYLVLMSADENFLNRIGSVLESAKWCRRLSQKAGVGTV